MIKRKIDNKSVQEIFELNPTQQGMLFHFLEDVQTNFYNVQLAFDIEGELDVEVLQEAIRITQSHNEALRSVFRWEEVRKPIQIVLRSCPFAFQFQDISSFNDSEKQIFADKWLEADYQLRFDLSELPLRFLLIQTAPQSFIFSISFHHILFDGWSNGILLRELFTHYKQLREGRPPEMELKPRFRDVRKAIDASFSPDTARQFWTNYLDAYQVVPLFAKNQPEAHRQTHTQKHHLVLPLEPLAQYARQQNVTRAAVIYAAYGLLLQKYGNTADVVFGTTVANREAHIAGINQVMGNFINTIPLRLTKQDGQTLGQLVQTLNTELIQRRQHNPTSYAAIKNYLGLKPTEDLFDSVVVFENYPLDQELIRSNKGFDLQLRSFQESTDIPLLVTVFAEDDLKIAFSFNDQNLSESFVSKLAEHLARIIDTVLTTPEASVSSLSVVSPEEKFQLLFAFNDTQEDGLADKTLVDLFEEQVNRTPDQPAIVDKDRSLTFAELNAKSNQLARRLLASGLQPEEVVGMFLSRRQEIIVSMLGILKAGGAYLPLDPDFPADRIKYMVDSSALSCLLTETSLLAIGEQLDARIEIIDVCSEAAYAADDQNIGLALSPANLAYLIYTSGSTGQPKGIMIEHRAMVNYVEAVAHRVQTASYHSILCLTTISFDIVATEIFLPLLKGLRIVLAGSQDQKDPDALNQLIVQEGVDLLQITPSHLSLLLNGKSLQFLQSIQAIMVGGEAFPFELFRELRNHFEGKIFNMYGPTETTVWSTIQDLTDKSAIDIGQPIRNTTTYVLDRNHQLQPIGVAGELCIGGSGLARGYWKREDLTREKFIDHPFAPGERIYKTGDLAVWLPNGDLKLLGRMDNQVKIRGFRIELGEIENCLLSHANIREGAAVIRDNGKSKVIASYYVAERELESGELKTFLAEKLPDYMIPAYFVRLAKLPLTPNGKLNRKALPAPDINQGLRYQAPLTEAEEKLGSIWSDLLGHEEISTHVNFFDIGGDSLKLISASNQIRKVFQQEVSLNDLFSHPTISSLALFLSRDPNGPAPARTRKQETSSPKPADETTEIAVIGMAGRFPGAPDLETFWTKLRQGEDLISREADSQPGALVKAKGFLREYDHFDARFFNYTPAEATMMDPQIRVFHECVYEGLEHAGYNPYQYPGRIGLYGGATPNPYFNIQVPQGPSEDWIEKWDELTYADKDFLCPRVSYKLNLKGPSVNISTACSTSLVAVDKACNELRAGKCEIAVAGGVSVTLYDNDGYYYRKDMIMSPDGTCRAFDEQSSGTVGGNGAGVVVLKKLADALRDGDSIHAIIKGTATNNDGNEKIGFTAPSIQGQSQVIEMALENAGIAAESISYVETHGTGTSLGDPIEISALTQAFGTDKKQYCAIGSVKTNIGHLDAAAGIAGLLKTILALKHKQLPPSLHFHTPNPAIDFANSPFFVNAALKDWAKNGTPRRAGVSSFGIGGTNAHVLLEEAPERKASSGSRVPQLLCLSAKSEKSLQGNLQRSLDYLHQSTENLADIAYTLQVGRESFPYRRAIVCRSREEAIALLTAAQSRKHTALSEAFRQVVFMFPGLGSQYPTMFADLYREESYFRETVDSCFAIVRDLKGEDLSCLLFESEETASDAAGKLNQIQYAHPLLFVVEYALAQLLRKWGIQPAMMIGHSIGEYVAACISGVFSLEDALKLVVKRSELIQHSREGSMLGISITEAALLPYLESHSDISLAAINSVELAVVSGETAAVLAFQERMNEDGYANQLVNASHASHSYMMEEIMETYAGELRGIMIRPPQIPFISNLTGKPASYEEIAEPGYWVRHLRETVRFSAGISTILAHKNAVCIEVGPGNVLGTFVRSNQHIAKTHRVVNPVRHAHKQAHDLHHLLGSMGKLWQNGITPDWDAFYEKEARRRVALAPYAFDRVSYPVLPQAASLVPQQARKHKDIAKWLYMPGWKLAPRIGDYAPNTPGEVCLFLADHTGYSEALIQAFAQAAQPLICVRVGAAFAQVSATAYHLNPASQADFVALFQHLAAAGSLPDRIIHGWGLSPIPAGKSLPKDWEVSYYSLPYLLKAAQQHGGILGKKLTVLSSGLHGILETEATHPLKGMMLGLLKVIPQEYPSLLCKHVDVALEPGQESGTNLYQEIFFDDPGKVISFRNGRRWEQTYEPIRSAQTLAPAHFRQNGVYLITGGLGDLGYHWALELQSKYQAKIALLGRTELGARAEELQFLQAADGDENRKEKIRRLQKLDANGGTVSYHAVDLSQTEAVRAAVAEIEQQYGPINGLIHTAGVLTGKSINAIRELERDDYTLQFSAKALGTDSLIEIFRDKNLDFGILVSSISSVIGGVSFGAYASANTYMDYALQAAALPNWLSLNLDGLNFSQAENSLLDPENIIEPGEFFAMIDLVLSLRTVPQIVVSTTDLQQRIEKWVTNSHILEEEALENLGDDWEILSEAGLSPLEGEVLKVWRSFFRIATLGMDDDFFEIGGNSLKALTMIGRIYKKFQVEISIKEFFNYSTARELSQLIRAVQEGDAPAQTAVTIPQTPAQDHYALSSAQKRLSFLYEFDPASLAYNIPKVFKLRGAVDQQRLTHAFQSLIQRHESFRTAIRLVEDQPVQVIAEAVEFEIESLTATPDELEKIYQQFIRPFDLSQPPLLRVALVTVGENEHLLLTDRHHILSDGISEGLMVRDFLSLYKGEVLAPPSLQYKDYTEWQQSETQQAALVNQRTFWRDQFAEEVSLLQLPIDFPRPQVQSFEGDILRFSLNEELTQGLKTLADQEGVTLFMVLLGLLNVLLSKLSNQENITIGTPVANRPHADLEEVIGMFVNTLALRNFPRKELSFREFLAEIKTQTLACFANQSYPYEELIEELNLRRDTSRNALFDVSLVLHNANAVDFSLPDLELEHVTLHNRVSKFDLSLEAAESEGQLRLWFEYASRLFRLESVERFAAYFQRIVQSVLENANRKLGEIEVLSPEERRQLLEQFTDTAVVYPADKNLLDLFEAQVAQTPDQVAVRWADQELSYQQLNEIANRIAAYLRELEGVQTGALVGLMLEREAWMIPSVFGILKAGAAYVPIDPHYPLARVNAIIEDAQLSVLITRSCFVPAELILKTGIIDLDQKEAVLENHPPLQSPVVVNPHDLAYVIYTSGSTGQPKGVMIEHHAVVNRLLWMQKAYPIGPEDVILQKTPVVFDVSVWELFWWSLTGASVALLGPGEEKDPSRIIDRVRQYKVSTLHFVPSMLGAFLADLGTETDYQALGSLRQVFASGEALKPEHVNVFGETLHQRCQTRLVNLYGPTEATVDVSYFECAFDALCMGVSIGKPIDNIRLYILNASGQLSPVGVAGELCIAGVGLARGYLGREELTAEKFIEHPQVPGERIYRTGDLARWRADGNIDFLGRIDYQVKIRGNRIELGEIESQLLQQQAIQDCTVLLRERAGNPYLVAYYVASEPLADEPLREYLTDRVPVYMVPGYFVHLEAFPLTPNGKLDRKALPDPEIQTAELYLPPQSESEKLLAEIWAAVLGIEQVGLTDNFFSLGGDSIKSIQISSRVRKAGYALSVQDLFGAQTIRKLASRLKPLTQRIEQASVKGTANLTGIQQAFFQGPVQDKHHYNQVVLLDFSQGISAEEVLRIFSQLQLHHDALRMVFREQNGEIVQENQGPDFPLSLSEWDLQTETDDVKLTQYANQLQAGFNLETGPLVKLGLFHKTDGSRLLIVIHHLIVDGMSWRILFEDLETLYQQLKSDQPFALPLKTTAYQDWSRKLQAYTETKSFVQASQYWASFPPVSTLLPIQPDFSAGENRQQHSQACGFQLSQTMTGDLLRNSHQAFQTQINDLLLAAFLLTIQKKYDQPAMLIALEGHGRETQNIDADISRTVGWFTSLYPVLLSHPGGGLSQLVKAVKEQLRKMPNHGRDYLLYKDTARFSPIASPEPAIIFNYLGQFDTDLADKSFSIAQESCGATRSPQDVREYEWEISGLVREGQLQLDLIYSGDRFHAATISQLMDAYKANLETLITYCANYGKTELSPSDLTYKELSISQLEALQALHPIEEIYPLSPMQEGMLFHTLLDETADHYFEQFVLQIQGSLDFNAVEAAFKDLLARYAVLRTSFLHEGYARPLQVVLRERVLDLQFHDIRALCLNETKAAVLESYYQQDRARKFDLRQDTLLRLTLLHTGEEHFEMIWSFHHILMDGWCLGLIFEDFKTLYQAHQQENGTVPQLETVEPYATYIDWLERREKEASAAYWQEYLQGYTELSGIPTPAHTRSSPSPYLKASHTLTLDPRQIKGLHKCAEQYGITINTILQTAWGVLLAKYNDTREVVFGAVVSGRPAEIEAIETMVGLFINTIPVRIGIGEDQTLVELLQNTQARALAGEAHHFHPLSEIQSQSTLGRGLLDHILVFENFPIAEELTRSAGAAAPFEVVGVSVFEQTNYDLSIVVFPGEQLSIQFRYNQAVYDAALIERAADHLNKIIYQILTDAKLPIAALNPLSPEEEEQVLYGFQTSQRFSTGKTVMDLFEEQARQNPQHIALRFQDQALTYTALNQKANQLAHFLQEKGVGPEVMVGICMDRSVEMIVGILGILKAGGAYVPIEPDYPEERMAFMLEDVGVDHLLSQASLGERLASMGERKPQIVALDEDWESIQTYPTQRPVRKSTEDNLMYVIYTSGSTGKPKGVLVENKSVVNYLAAQRQNYQFQPDERVLQFSTISFDASVEQIFLTLTNGATLVLVPRTTLLDTQAVGELVRKQAITHFHATPSYLNNFTIADFASLRRVVSGGEVCSRQLADRWVEHLQFFNKYGPTEATITCTLYYYADPKQLNAAELPIGKPLANTRIYILNTALQLCPIGIPGEIYIGGAGLSRGYLNRPELSQEKFIPNPFAQGERLYKTGDRAAWQADGSIRFLGRLDDQVKIRGYRLELGEIEHQLSGHPGIQDSVVLVRENEGAKQLVAYYVSERDLQSQHLRDWLSKQLPDYMIPSFFVPIETIPMNLNGKIDKDALPEPDMNTTGENLVPENEIEAGLRETWSTVLGIDKQLISLEKSFFELGGDSLKIVKLNSQINQSFDWGVSVPDLFRFPTIKSLAAHIGGKNDTAEGDSEEANEEAMEMREVINNLFQD